MIEQERFLQGNTEDSLPPARYELWDTESGNLIGAYTTEAEALAIVREAVTANGGKSVDGWSLASVGNAEDESPLLDGAALADHAFTTPASADAAP